MAQSNWYKSLFLNICVPYNMSTNERYANKITHYKTSKQFTNNIKYRHYVYYTN